MAFTLYYLENGELETKIWKHPIIDNISIICIVIVDFYHLLILNFKKIYFIVTIQTMPEVSFYSYLYTLSNLLTVVKQQDYSKNHLAVQLVSNCDIHSCTFSYIF